MLGAVPAGAQELAPELRDALLNKGEITKAEAQQALEAKFKAMDTNHDGVLSEDEFVNSGLARLEALDANHDGKVTREELRDAFFRRLTRQ